MLIPALAFRTATNSFNDVLLITIARKSWSVESSISALGGNATSKCVSLLNNPPNNNIHCVSLPLRSYTSAIT